MQITDFTEIDIENLDAIRLRICDGYGNAVDKSLIFDKVKNAPTEADRTTYIEFLVNQDYVHFDGQTVLPRGHFITGPTFATLYETAKEAKELKDSRENNKAALEKTQLKLAKWAFGIAVLAALGTIINASVNAYRLKKMQSQNETISKLETLYLSKIDSLRRELFLLQSHIEWKEHSDKLEKEDAMKNNIK